MFLSRYCIFVSHNARLVERGLLAGDAETVRAVYEAAQTQYKPEPPSEPEPGASQLLHQASSCDSFLFKLSMMYPHLVQNGEVHPAILSLHAGPLLKASMKVPTRF